MPVHLRLNDKDTTRNPYINFVTALPGPRHDEALHRLQQLAAMVKPLMKEQGFHINSLEEYEWNREFAGRCWNNGEVVELVLTSARGEWMPLQYVLYVFCHELAHIKHMNHIPALHGALTRHLKQTALEKQRQGYYGDGLWSSGRKLSGGGFVEGLGMQQQSRDNLPEHVCGGAFSRKAYRSSGRKRRRRQRANGSNGSAVRRKFNGPSLHTGAQTAPSTRGGSRRVTLDVAAKGEGGGTRVDGRNWLPTATAKDTVYKQDENSTFRKRAQSKDARQKRASAALARFAAAAAAADAKPTPLKEEHRTAPFDGASDIDSINDQVSSSSEDDNSDSDSVTEDDDDDDKADVCGTDVPQTKFTYGWKETAEQRKRRMQRFQHLQEGHLIDEDESGKGRRIDEWDSLLGETDVAVLPPAPTTTHPPHRRDSEARTTDTAVGQSDAMKAEEDIDDDIVFVEERPAKRSQSQGVQKASSRPVPSAARRLDQRLQWGEHKRQSPDFYTLPPLITDTGRSFLHKCTSVCLLCTLVNEATHKRCAACDTTRGKKTLGE